jgi:hypothetical protein
VGSRDIAEQNVIKADALLLMEHLMGGQSFFSKLAGVGNLLLGQHNWPTGAQGIGSALGVFAEAIEAQACSAQLLGLRVKPSNVAALIEHHLQKASIYAGVP